MKLMLSLMLPLSFCAMAQESAKPAPEKPKPDVIVFTNGDQMTGTLERAQGGNVIFKSDMAGELTVSFDKIKELRSGAQFALLRKGTPLGRKQTIQPEGTVTVANGQVIVSQPGQPEVMESAANVDQLVGRADYDRQINSKAGLRDGWSGTLTGGATLVRSTTTGTTLTAGAALVRAVPTVPWMAPRNRTTIDLNESYGRSSSPMIPPNVCTAQNPNCNAPTVVLTSIFHADAERDEYLSPRVYVLADTSFDHNYSQGLQLQQIYGGGFGWTPVKNAKQELDLKVDAHYEKQQFITTPVNGAVVASTPSMNIIGSTIFEGYRRNLPRRVVFTQTANILPAWNDFSAYSANVTAALLLPVYKRMSATITTTDNYLNDPAPFYRKNSVQFVTGVTYSLK